MIGIITCKDCQYRYVGCHSLCEKYKEAREENKRLKESLKRSKVIENDLRKYHKEKYSRLSKRNNV